MRSEQILVSEGKFMSFRDGLEQYLLHRITIPHLAIVANNRTRETQRHTHPWYFLRKHGDKRGRWRSPLGEVLWRGSGGTAGWATGDGGAGPARGMAGEAGSGQRRRAGGRGRRGAQRRGAMAGKLGEA